MWSGVVTGKYRTGNATPVHHMKKQNSEHNFKQSSLGQPNHLSAASAGASAGASATSSPADLQNKLTRSRTYVDYPRRSSNSSSDSYSNSSRRPSNYSTSSSTSSRRGSGPPAPVSLHSATSRSKRPLRSHMANAGRGHLTAIKAETSVDLIEKADSPVETIKKPIFY